jgi:hypothetical protein
MIFLDEGDGRLGPPEPHRGSKGVDGAHLLLGDAALPIEFIHLGALKDHEVVLGLREFIVLLLGVVRQVINFRAGF